MHRQFEQLSRFFDDYSSLIPLTFVLAFYVSHVISRWWDQWNSIPWPDAIAFKVNAYVNGDDEHSRLVRRNVVRYACLAIVDTLCMVCTKVKKRFPTKEHLVEAGLLTEEEARGISLSCGICSIPVHFSLIVLVTGYQACPVAL